MDYETKYFPSFPFLCCELRKCLPFTMESRLVGTVRVSVNFRSSSSLVWCILRQWRLMLRRDLKSWPQRQHEIVTSSTWIFERHEEEASVGKTMSAYLFIYFFSPSLRTLASKLCLTLKSGTHPASGPLVFMLCLLIFRLLFAFPPPQSLIGCRAAVTLRPSWLTELVVVPALHRVSFPRHRTLSGTANKVETKNQKRRRVSLAGASNPIPGARRFLGEKQTAPRRVWKWL